MSPSTRRRKTEFIICRAVRGRKLRRLRRVRPSTGRLHKHVSFTGVSVREWIPSCDRITLQRNREMLAIDEIRGLENGSRGHVSLASGGFYKNRLPFAWQKTRASYKGARYHNGVAVDRDFPAGYGRTAAHPQMSRELHISPPARGLHLDIGQTPVRAEESTDDCCLPAHCDRCLIAGPPARRANDSRSLRPKQVGLGGGPRFGSGEIFLGGRRERRDQNSNENEGRKSSLSCPAHTKTPTKKTLDNFLKNCEYGEGSLRPYSRGRARSRRASAP